MRFPVTLALLSVAVLNALCYPLITVGREFAPLYAFAALRALIAGLTLAILAILFRRPIPTGLRVWLILVAMGIATTSLGYLGMFQAAGFVSPGLATVIANSQPLVAAILAQLFLQERLRRPQLDGLFLGFAGIVTISVPHMAGADGAGFIVGLMYITLAVGGVAVGNVMMKALGGQIDPLVAMAAQMLFGAVPLTVAAAAHGHFATITWSPAFVGSLVGLALPGTAFAYWLWFMALERIPLSRANAFTFLTPFVGLILGVTFFREHVGAIAISGLLLTVAGLTLVERSGLSPARRS